MIDVPLLRKELEFISAHPERWKQGCWIARTECGTVGCIAGNTVLHAGYEPAFGLTDDLPYHAACVVRPNSNGNGHGYVTVETVARELLGLTLQQTNDLFYPHNSLYDLWFLASEYTDGEIQVPVDVVPGSESRYG